MSETKCECPARKALELAIMTVECASIDMSVGPTQGQELPWYKAARAALSAPCPCEGLREKAIAEFIDDHGINCDCCGHVMIDVTSAQTEEKQHCVAGDSEGEGVGCAHSWHETVGHVEDERDQLRAALVRKINDYSSLWAECEGLRGRLSDYDNMARLRWQQMGRQENLYPGGPLAAYDTLIYAARDERDQPPRQGRSA